jgi:hypothetical protein
MTTGSSTRSGAKKGDAANPADQDNVGSDADTMAPPKRGEKYLHSFEGRMYFESKGPGAIRGLIFEDALAFVRRTLSGIKYRDVEYSILRGRLLWARD